MPVGEQQAFLGGHEGGPGELALILGPLAIYAQEQTAGRTHRGSVRREGDPQQPSALGLGKAVRALQEDDGTARIGDDPPGIQAPLLQRLEPFGDLSLEVQADSLELALGEGVLLALLQEGADFPEHRGVRLDSAAQGPALEGQCEDGGDQRDQHDGGDGPRSRPRLREDLARQAREEDGQAAEPAGPAPPCAVHAIAECFRDCLVGSVRASVETEAKEGAVLTDLEEVACGERGLRHPLAVHSNDLAGRRDDLVRRVFQAKLGVVLRDRRLAVGGEVDLGLDTGADSDSRAARDLRRPSECAREVDDDRPDERGLGGSLLGVLRLGVAAELRHRRLR